MSQSQPSTRKIFLRLLTLLIFGNVTIVLTGMAWFDEVGRSLIKEGDAYAARMYAEGVASTVRIAAINEDYDAMEHELRQAMTAPDIAELTVTDASGLVLARLQRNRAGAEPVGLYWPRRMEHPASLEPVVNPAGERTLWVRLDSVDDLGWLQLRFLPGSAVLRLQQLRWQIVEIVGLGGAFMLVLILVLLRNSSDAITRREDALLNRQGELQSATRHDALTGLLNRVGMFEQLAAAIKAREPDGQPLAICFLDLDGFKAVNDQWGHDVGDDLLVAVARRLENSVRDADIVARLAGDEFVLILDGEQEAGELHRLLGRIVSAVGEPVAFENVRVTVGCSIGVMLCTSADADPEAMLRKADEAMYMAKSRGRNRWVIHDSALAELLTPAVPVRP